MAQDIFLKIDGINGESLDDKHKDEIEILNWDWEILQESSMHSGSGGGAGKATVKDLTFEHNIDRASPNLMKYALTGKHIDQAVLVMRKAGEEKSRETVSLSFSKVKQEYVVQNAQGGSGGAVTASFDIKGNKEA
ncbi:type VI secretion system tube protein Hcp [Burkholderia multivorans]|uniref:Hcp family type VI secretion system effector n=1 Tax=Burkholderia multivorans TaxID=87883 RepID=UPI001C219742|nr:type VI secretion system tube protein Hcp [Burkholderia multivorans]MBU9420101.1 type VI secretion system tube protein Hcp [Burkholderia multivorans]